MAYDGENSSPQVVLDANLLYPFHLRNLLVQFGVDAIITPRWTARIHAEWIDNLVATGKVPKERLLLTLNLMNKALPTAEIQGWETHMRGLELPDPNDHHVLAAAMAARAKTILTMNLRDFPPAATAKHGVTATHPDTFLCRLQSKDPNLLQASTEAAQANLSRTTPSFAAYLDVLDHQGLPRFSHRLRK